MIGKIIGLTVFFAALITQAGAQELGIELNGGLQGMQYQLQNGQVKQLPGGSLGLNYSFRLSSHWGLLTGIGCGLYRTQASLQNGVVFASGQVDDAGSAFQYSVKPEGYEETQQFIAASIPLLLQYHTDGIGKQWYFQGGGKIFFPFMTSIQVSAAQLNLSGYYPDYNIEVSSLPQHGFGTINSWKTSVTTELKPAAALSAATGFSFPLSPGLRLYAGLYVDYGLTRLIEMKDSMPFATYSSTGVAGVKAGGVLNMPDAGRVGLLSLGVQLRLSFGAARPKHAARAESKKETQPAATQEKQPAETPHGKKETQPAATPYIKKETQPSEAPEIGHDLLEVMQRPVLFGLPGETTLSENQKERLDKVVDIMRQYPGIRIAIAGHTCNSDKIVENKKVGTARAKAVATYLRSKGIERSRMDVSPIVESHLFVSYDPAANYRNRRAAIKVE